jgi:hypothetical protein
LPRYDLGDLAGIEMAVLTTDESMKRAQLRQADCGTFGYARICSQQEYSVAMPGAL